MLNLNDNHIGILAELYWNGYQYSRTTPALHKEIRELIEEGFIDEFEGDTVFWGMQWFVKITDAGKWALTAADYVKVFHHFIGTVVSVKAACTWVAKFTLDQLPEALTHENEEVRDKAVQRLGELTCGTN